MKTYTRITEKRGLSALLGKSPVCLWQTECTGYVIRLWGEYLDGEMEVLQQRDAETYAKAQAVAQEMRRAVA